MKRILSIALILALCISFAGCKQDKGRELYNVNLEKYVELGEYKGIKVDTNSKEFEEYGTSYILNDVLQNNLQSTESIKEGKVAMGDTVNIDYVGKKDGVAFEGGTAQGYDLTIGSGAFIEGFEDGLIGKEIGSTVDLNLTFPENYQNAELQGAKVVFTVTINSVKPAKTPEEFYGTLGYASVEEYYDVVKQKTISAILQKEIIENSKVLDYPKKDMDLLYQDYYSGYEEQLQSYYQMSVENFLSTQGITEEEFKESIITEEIKPLMDMQMVWYAIFDNEDMQLTQEDTDNKIKAIIAQNGDSSIDRTDVIEQMGEYYIEMLVVSDKVFEFVEKNAVIS